MRSILLALSLALAPVAVPSAFAQDDPEDSPSSFEKLRAMEPEIMARIAERAPDKHQQLLKLKQLDRHAYYKALGQIVRAHRSDRPDPEAEALIDRLEALRARYPDGADDLPKAEQKQVRAELESIAEQMFDLKQAHRRAKIEELRKALETLEAEVAERDQERDARIRAFVDRAMQGPVDL